MNSIEPAKYQTILGTIRQWPPEARRDLLRDVRRTLDERPGRPTRGYFADDVIRTLKPDRPAPTDEECERILEEELMRKIRAMRVLIDTNVALDVILERQPWLEDSKGVWDACQEMKIVGHLVATSLIEFWFHDRNLSAEPRALAEQCFAKP